MASLLVESPVCEDGRIELNGRLYVCREIHTVHGLEASWRQVIENCKQYTKNREL